MDEVDPVFSYDTYKVRRKIFAFLGQKFYIRDAQDRDIGFVAQKAFKLKEDIRVFRTPAQKDELLCIKARNIIDISATYDVIDSKTQEKVGALRRQGLKSMLRDSWEILDTDDEPYGTIQEESAGLALVRRFIGGIINILAPQAFDVALNGRKIGRMKQNHNIFVPTLMVELSDSNFDRRIGIAAAVLLSAIEGRQQ